MNRKLPTVVCIMGPTASGKTSLAIEAAKQLNGEVVSVDSALIYKSMDIGTAKPSMQERDGIPHHLIDIICPDTSYSVGDFLKDAQNSIDDILSRDKLPILAGGTMMYFNALIKGINELPVSEVAVREKVQEQIVQKGLSVVHQQLQEIDPTSAKRIHKNDSQRITRALEVFFTSGKTLTEWQNAEKSVLPYDFQQFSIMPADREQLHKNIVLRFDQMLAQGLVNEVRHLISKYTLHEDMPALRSVGYRQVWQHLQGQLDEVQMRERGIIATRQLAKRQVTWLRAWDDLTELETSANNNIDRLVEKLSAT
jgi:tRNA dimethylallyltransferase